MKNSLTKEIRLEDKSRVVVTVKLGEDYTSRDHLEYEITARIYKFRSRQSVFVRADAYEASRMSINQSYQADLSVIVKTVGEVFLNEMLTEYYESLKPELFKVG